MQILQNRNQPTYFCVGSTNNARYSYGVPPDLIAGVHEPSS